MVIPAELSSCVRCLKQQQDKAYINPARTGGNPCSQRLCQDHWQGGGLHGHLRTRCHQSGNGIGECYMDSIPLVAITGQVPTVQVGTDAFQEVDITGITMPITKHNYLVKDAKMLPMIIKRAFHIARTGRPGPVLIDLPKDVAYTSIDFEYPEVVNLMGYKLRLRATQPK
ncbi:hypothetical protein N752_10610 [Desulforamulus aquiferis]|nr:hypothetical protein N752_10610 [Desulforamulus aquiferis]